MRYLVRCNLCGATAWVSGEDDPDTNALELNFDKTPEWLGGVDGCDHADHEVVDQAYPEPHDTDVM